MSPGCGPTGEGRGKGGGRRTAWARDGRPPFRAAPYCSACHVPNANPGPTPRVPYASPVHEVPPFLLPTRHQVLLGLAGGGSTALGGGLGGWGLAVGSEALGVGRGGGGGRRAEGAVIAQHRYNEKVGDLRLA